MGDTGLEPVTSALSIRPAAQTTTTYAAESACLLGFPATSDVAAPYCPASFVGSMWEVLWGNLPGRSARASYERRRDRDAFGPWGCDAVAVARYWHRTWCALWDELLRPRSLESHDALAISVDVGPALIGHHRDPYSPSTTQTALGTREPAPHTDDPHVTTRQASCAKSKTIASGCALCGKIDQLAAAQPLLVTRPVRK